MRYSQKKGISPIVATALLLVVVVAGAVAFQVWYGAFQSDITSSLEEDTDSGIAIAIQRLESSGSTPVVYVKSTGDSDVNTTTVSVRDNTGTTVCSNSSVLTITSNNVTTLTTGGGSCGLTEGSSYDVVVVTTTGTTSTKLVAR